MAAKVGGEVMMRLVNDENGLATKMPSVARDKANRDYRGDVSRVVDLIGGTCVMPADGDFADAVKAVQGSLPEGSMIAKVKKLVFDTMEPQYRDVKVSVRFANGGIGEIILVQDVINDAKFNRGGHLLYDVTRELAPYREIYKEALNAYKVLDDLSALVYQADAEVDAEIFAHSKSKASSALDALKPLLKKLSLSSFVATAVKSSDSLLKKAKPASVSSAALPSRSLIQNIPEDMIGDRALGVNNISASLTGDGARAMWRRLLEGKVAERVVDFKGVPVDLAVSTEVHERAGDALWRVIMGDYWKELVKWEDATQTMITDVVSAYSADSMDKYEAMLKGGQLRYADKERALMWASAEGDSVLQLLTTALRHSGSRVMLKENQAGVNTNFSASLTGAGAVGRRVLDESGDEYVASRLREAWQKNLEKWSVLHAGREDGNEAMRAVMEMEGLVKATYDVVREDVKLGRGRGRHYWMYRKVYH